MQLQPSPEDYQLDMEDLKSTKQLLCSSCQGIFLDTDNLTMVQDFCKRFLSCLEDAARDYQAPGIGIYPLRKYTRVVEYD